MVAEKVWSRCEGATAQGKLSQRELAKRAKFSVSTLVHIEKGLGNPMLNSLENLAIALGTRLSRLFELTQDRKER
ncbi:MAG: hypothetical protein JWQ87_5531 [Candidatus Sulfotelmatobacter sp.]|nr:hypothetical protein [Candidatus Sulfotelmatobacter sp.]